MRPALERRAGAADGLLRALDFQGRMEFHALVAIGRSYAMGFEAVSRWIVVAERGGLLACCGMGSWFCLTDEGREVARRTMAGEAASDADRRPSSLPA
jgi:hypothetical protein